MTRLYLVFKGLALALVVAGWCFLLGAVLGVWGGPTQAVMVVGVQGLLW